MAKYSDGHSGTGGSAVATEAGGDAASGTGALGMGGKVVGKARGAGRSGPGGEEGSDGRLAKCRLLVGEEALPVTEALVQYGTGPSVRGGLGGHALAVLVGVSGAECLSGRVPGV